MAHCDVQWESSCLACVRHWLLSPAHPLRCTHSPSNTVTESQGSLLQRELSLAAPGCFCLPLLPAPCFLLLLVFWLRTLPAFPSSHAVTSEFLAKTLQLPLTPQKNVTLISFCVSFYLHCPSDHKSSHSLENHTDAPKFESSALASLENSLSLNLLPPP